MIYNKEIPTKATVDVCVIGGGPTGVAAAITAARAGASVFLIESQGCFGGAGTSGLVTSFAPFTDGVNFMCGGIGKEVYDRIVAAGSEFNGRWVIYKPESLKKVYDEMVEQAGVDFLFFTSLVDVVCQNGKVSAVIASCKSGLVAIKAKCFVDATGDGDLCAMAGAPYEKGDEKGLTMGATLCSLWMNIDWTRCFWEQERELERAFADGTLSQEDRHLPGLFKTGEQSGLGNIGHVFGVDGTNEHDLTNAMIKGRKLLPEFVKYYNQYVGDAFEKAYPVATAATLGVRESRRITCDYVLNLDDYNKRSIFDDEIGRFYYAIDMHENAATKEAYEEFYELYTQHCYKDGETYGIPYRSITPLTLDNVWVGGRCISTDRSMQSSIRVMPCCFITGQAAGMAAAICAKNGYTSRELEVNKLQRALADIGAFLPNLK